MSPDVETLVAEEVEAACAAESNAFGYGIWTHHVTRVAENTRALADEFGAGEEIVVLGALLHDYASVLDEALYEDHHVHGPREAERLLSELDYPDERIRRVKECIAAHRGSVDAERRTPEAACLATADAMAHVQHPHSLVYLAYVEHGMDIDEGARWVREKLRRSWEKMDDEAREAVRAEYENALAFLDR